MLQLHEKHEKDCKYCISYALVIAWFRGQYDKYFSSFSYSTDLFHKPEGKRNNGKL